MVLIVDVEGVDGGLEAILHLEPPPLAAPGGERVEFPLGDGDDGEGVALSSSVSSISWSLEDLDTRGSSGGSAHVLEAARPSGGV